jgi:epoxyqueuosine reductase
MSDIADKIESLITDRGLVLLGMVPLSPEESYQAFSHWLERGWHAGMAFLTRHKSIRKNPQNLLEGGKSGIVIGFPYQLSQKAGLVGQYARYRDYHRFLRRMLEEIVSDLKPTLGEFQSRVTVDSAPLLERALAAKGGRGFIGKNTLYIHRQIGSFVLLAEILLDIPLPYDQEKAIDHSTRGPDGGCGSCRRCQVYCPTQALSKDYSLDANKCLAYYTIEHRGPIPREYWPWLAVYFFGCDICQLVCPFNRSKADENRWPALRTSELPPMFEIACMDQAFYEKHFGGTPLTRAKKEGLIRNALINMHVTKHPRLLEAMAFLNTYDNTMIQQTLEAIRNEC